MCPSYEYAHSGRLGEDGLSHITAEIIPLTSLTSEELLISGEFLRFDVTPIKTSGETDTRTRISPKTDLTVPLHPNDANHTRQD